MFKVLHWPVAWQDSSPEVALWLSDFYDIFSKSSLTLTLDDLDLEVSSYEGSAKSFVTGFGLLQWHILSSIF